MMEREEIIKALQCRNNGCDNGCTGLNGFAAAMLEADASEIAPLKEENDNWKQAFVSYNSAFTKLKNELADAKVENERLHDMMIWLKKTSSEVDDAIKFSARLGSTTAQDIDEYPKDVLDDMREAAEYVERLHYEIEKLKAENERIRQNSVSHEVYLMACEERDAAENDITEMAASAAPCCWCAKKQGWTTCKECHFEWRGVQKGKE